MNKRGIKKLFFGSNLKMYKSATETSSYLVRLQELTTDIDRDKIELFILPSFVCLERALNSVEPAYIRIGAQTLFWEEKGQYTGEISPGMLEDLGISMVMVGHSERRHVFGETNEEESQRVAAALRHRFVTLLCVGETLEEKEAGQAEETIRQQLLTGFSCASAEDVSRIRVAYEPVWSIGVHGIPADPSYAEYIHSLIKTTLTEMFGRESEMIPVLYGGSVNPGNASELISLPSVDGLYVGRSAWDADDFNVLIRQALKSAEETGKVVL